jgi:hypothetical protein
VFNKYANQKCAIGRGLAAISYKYSFQFILHYLQLIEALDNQGTGTTFRAISGRFKILKDKYSTSSRTSRSQNRRII